MTTVFIHGLDSSSRGAKGSWFAQHFPNMLIPDFTGSLTERLVELDRILTDKNDLLLIGSSFGGLMAAIFALENPGRVQQIILLAPALNFPDFANWAGQTTTVPTLLYIGKHDTVCPPEIVIPAARTTFSELIIHQTDDDHLLRATFPAIDWPSLLGGDQS